MNNNDQKLKPVITRHIEIALRLIKSKTSVHVQCQEWTLNILWRYNVAADINFCTKLKTHLYLITVIVYHMSKTHEVALEIPKAW